MTKKSDYRWIRKRLQRVRVHSCADGSFGIEAKWREPYAFKYSSAFPAGQGEEPQMQPPGLFTRMATAEEIEMILNRVLYTSEKIEGVK
jgi:hypothetical protein